MNSKKQKAPLFIIVARVVVLITLLFVLTLPLSLAWFTDKAQAPGEVEVNFGTVSVGLDKTDGFTDFLVADTGSRTTIYPNDIYNFSFDIKNQKVVNGTTYVSNVDILAIYNYKVAVMYGEGESAEDITNLLTNGSTKYIVLNETKTPTYFDSENKVLELAKGAQTQPITIAGTLKISGELPNELVVGSKTYYFNQKTRVIDGITYTKDNGMYPKIYLALKISVDAVQKDNNVEIDASTGLERLTATALNHFEIKREGVTNSLNVTTNTSNITLTNPDTYTIKNMKIYGNSIQKTVAGTNLFNPNVTPINIGSYYGIDMVDHTAGDYTLKVVLKEGREVPSGCFGYVYKKPTSTYGSAYWVVDKGNFVGTTDSLTYSRVRFDHQPTALELEYSGLACYREGDNISAWKDFIDAFDIYFVKGKYSAETIPMDPYVGGADSPNPEYPQEIQSFGEKTVNLAPFINDLTKTYKGVTLTIKDQTLILNGTVTSNFQFGLYINNNTLDVQIGVIGTERANTPFINLKNGSYVQSLNYLGGTIEGDGTKYYGLYTYKSGVSILDTRQYLLMNNNSKEFTISEDTEAQFFVIQFVALNKYLTFNNYRFRIQIEEGLLATDYEPYGKYKIEINQRSKNLFDINNYTKINSCLAFDISKLKIGTKYTISSNKSLGWLKISNSNTGYNSVQKDNKTFTEYSFDMQRHANISATSPQYLFLAEIRANGFFTDISQLEGYNIQIEEGETATAYEPYVNKTTKIYLDEPLRKVGEYADYIDLTTGKVVRKVKCLTLKVDEMNNSDDYPGWRKTPEALELQTDLGINEVDVGIAIHTTYMTNVSSSNWLNMNCTVGDCTLYFTQSKFGLTQSQFKAKYAGLEVLLCYGLKSPTEEYVDISGFSTYEGATNLTINAGGVAASKIEMEYYTNAPL